MKDTDCVTNACDPERVTNAVLSNAERQRRWRERLKDRADALDGTPKEIAGKLLAALGVDKAKKVIRALEKRLRAIKPDCPHCRGTGFVPMTYSSACGMPLGAGRLPCTCDENNPLGWKLESPDCPGDAIPGTAPGLSPPSPG